MTLRQRMLEDMQVRNLSPPTQRAYVETVAPFARHFGRSPARSALHNMREVLRMETLPPRWSRISFSILRASG
jgi:hypothetical protein